MTIPFLEVAHLASSSSFYSAVLQALGLRYIANPESGSSSTTTGPCITYGTSLPPTPVFQLRQVHSPKASRIVLTAQSPAAVTDFHRFSLQANPDLVTAADLGASGGGTAASPETEESRARIIDYDGNTMEVVYRPPYQPRHGEPSIRHTQSTTAEANRILKWNYGTVASNPPTIIGRRTDTSHFRGDDEPYAGLRRAMTSTTLYDTAPSPREGSNGFSTSAVMGTLLGVAAGAAAGAAITYSMVKNEHSRAARHESEAPAFTRRCTFPVAHFSEDRSAPRYVEVERTVEKVRYPNECPPVDARRSPPAYMARYSQAGGSGSPRASPAEEVYDDKRSRHSSRHGHGSSTSRTRSANPEKRRPLMITETEHRSYVGSGSTHSSRHGSTPPITRGIQRSHTFDVSDRESYVSTRSERSENTIRPAAAASQYVVRSRAGSHTPRALSRTGSYMSARNVPLPGSVAGTAYGSHPWNVPLPPSAVDSSWDDDAGSVAPSDSISCVGSKRSGRSCNA